MPQQLQDITQRILLEASAPKAMLSGLDETILKLEKIENYINALNSLSTGAKWKRSAAEFSSQIKTTGTQKTAELAKLYGFDPSDVTMFGAKLDAAHRENIRKLEQTMSGMTRVTPSGRISKAYQAQANKLAAEQQKLYFTSAQAENLRSPVAAGKFFETYARTARRSDQGRMVDAMIKGNAGGGFTPTASEINLTNAAVKVVGEIIIPASQIKVVGDVTMAGGGGSAGGGRDPVSGKFTGGNGGNAPRRGRGGGEEGGGGGEPYDPPAAEGELERVVVKSGDEAKTTITELEELGTTISTTYDELGEEVRSRLRIKRGAAEMEDLRARQAAFAATLKAESAKLAPGDFTGLAKLKTQGAEHLEGLISPEMLEALEARGVTGPQTKIAGQAEVLRAQAAAAERKAAEARQQAYAAGLSSPARFAAATARPTLAEKRAQAQERQQEAQAIREMRRAQKVHRDLLYEANSPPVIPKIKLSRHDFERPRKPQEGPGGFLGMAQGFAGSIGTAAGWSTAYQGVHAVEEALKFVADKTVEVQTQMGVLDNVFRRVGGSTAQLTQDILQLAGATGVDTETAMQTATAWARLGLSRQGVVSATRQTAILANTSGGTLDQAQGQKYLASVMANYHLSTADLPGVVSMLTTENARSGVSQKDILEGMTKAGPAAARGGMGIAELSAIIAMASRRSGDTGMQAGNSFRTILSGLSDPALQNYLAENFGIQPLNAQGQPRSTSEMWRELHSAYAGASPERQNLMANRVAGTYRASRFQAMMESYGDAEDLARRSTENPNAGEEAQGRMMQGIGMAWKGLQSQLVAMATGPMTRETAGTGDMTPGGTAAEALNFLKNLAAFSTRVTNMNPLFAFNANVGGAGLHWLNSRMGGGAPADAGEMPQQLRSLEDVEDAEGLDQRRQAVLTYLRERKDLMEGIVALAQQMPVVGEEGHVLAQRRSLAAQDLALTQAVADLGALPGDKAAKEKAFKQLEEEQLEIRSQLTSATSGPQMALAEIMSGRNVATERAQGFAGEVGILGHTPFEQMLNRESGITGEINRLNRNPDRTDMEDARLQELYKQQYQNRVSEAHRSEELPQLIRQNQAESQRRFTRDSLFAGPQELLARIGMTRLSESNGGRGLGAGGFFALSPEDRRLYDDLHGGDEGARLREEARLAQAHGRALTPSQEAAFGQEEGGRIDATGRRMDRATAPIEASLRAARSLDAMTQASARLATSQNQLAAATTNLISPIGLLGNVIKAAISEILTAAGHPGAAANWIGTITPYNPQSGGYTPGRNAGSTNRPVMNISDAQ